MFIDYADHDDLSRFVQPDQVAQSAAHSTTSFDEQYAQARAWANGGQPDLAIQAYSALLERSPGNADVLLGRGLAYSRTGRYAQAEADLATAAASAPGYADVWLALGKVYRFTGRPGEAVVAYDRALALRPEDADAKAARGSALEAQQGQGGSQRADRSLGASLPARAATPDALSSRFTWSASVATSASRVSPGGQRWNDQVLAVRRHAALGSLGFEALSASRFGQRDHAWALDGYVGLWPRAYANLRYQHAPVASLFPEKSWRAELYQGVGNGWELSASNDTLHFDASRVRILGAGVAKYIGNFYVLYRHTEIETRGTSGKSDGDRALVRYYYAGDGDNYVEFSANRGTSDDPLSLLGGRSRSGGRSLAFVRYLTPQWGLKLGAHSARQDAGGSERGLSAALYRRW